ncbi:MalY/PatB family protein [Anaerorhabdus sp.]|uniref:MalY/PatB family protein n=1 Tax=Anaerorhabdus sp. TaxID=1872524 RepID=UPI002FC88F60
MKYDFNTVVNRTGTGSLKWKNAEKILNKPCTIPPLSTADMEFVACPSVVSQIEEAMHHQGVFGYTSCPDGYTKTVVNWLKEEHQFDCDEAWILQTFGVIQAIHHIVNCFTSVGDDIIIQTPVYHQFKKIINHTQRNCVENALRIVGGRYEMDFDDLEQKAKSAKMLILCSPHNPIGRVWTIEELKRVQEIAEKNNLLVVADEIHFDFILDGKHTVFANLMKDNVILCTSPSKTFNLAGLNLANIIIPNQGIKKKLEEHLENEDVHYQTYFGYHACMGAYSNEGRVWKNELTQVIQNNFDVFKKFIEESLPTCTLFHLEGTYLAWLDCNGLGYSEDILIEMLNKEEIFVDRGSTFGHNGTGFIRINLACPTSVIFEVIGRFKKCFGNKI